MIHDIGLVQGAHTSCGSFILGRESPGGMSTCTTQNWSHLFLYGMYFSKCSGYIVSAALTQKQKTVWPWSLIHIFLQTSALLPWLRYLLDLYLEHEIAELFHFKTFILRHWTPRTIKLFSFTLYKLKSSASAHACNNLWRKNNEKSGISDWHIFFDRCGHTLNWLIRKHDKIPNDKRHWLMTNIKDEPIIVSGIVSGRY